jgi:hypothetical protein
MSKHSIKVIAALIVFTVFAFYAVFYGGLDADTCACVYGLVAFIGIGYAFKDDIKEWANGERR